MREQDVEAIADELTMLETLANEFEEYIVAGEVYRTVLIPTDHGNRRIEMSGGDLLTRLKTTLAIQANLPREMKDQFNSIVTQVEVTKQELKTRFHDLLRRELSARLDSLRWSDEERKQDENEEEQMTPAEKHNLQCIAAIRGELGQKIPQDVVDEMDAIEKQLQAAIDQFNQQ